MRRLLLSAAALALIAGTAVAQPQNDQRDSHPARAERPAGRPQQGAAPSHAPQFRSNGETSGPMRGFAPRPEGPARGGQIERVNPRPNGANTFAPADRFAPRTNGGAYNHPTQRFEPGTTGRAYRGPVTNGTSRQWNGQNRTGGHGHVWDRDGQRWSGSNAYNRRDWSRLHRNSWWWGRRGFDNYQGWRQGFWFAPGWGYYQPDPQYYDYDWEVGDVVPYDLRGYYVSDPYDYGLPPPAYGTQWIFLGDELVLIDQYSGVIIEIGAGY